MIAGDWNMGSDVLDSVGYPWKLGMIMMAPTTHAGRSSTSNSIIDYATMSPGLARLRSSVRVDPSWVVKPHRPIRPEIRFDVLRNKQLVHRAHPRWPTDP
eukprot:3357308-Pyramimonas_sp.AAC.1